MLLFRNPAWLVQYLSAHPDPKGSITSSGSAFVLLRIRNTPAFWWLWESSLEDVERKECCTHLIPSLFIMMCSTLVPSDLSTSSFFLPHSKLSRPDLTAIIFCRYSQVVRERRASLDLHASYNCVTLVLTLNNCGGVNIFGTSSSPKPCWAFFSVGPNSCRGLSQVAALC